MRYDIMTSFRLSSEPHAYFACEQALNLILLTAPELLDLRGALKQSLAKGGRTDLFWALYPSWCHSPVSTVSLCLLAQVGRADLQCSPQG